ncbi:Class I SAM-dependent methyltransferase [Gammaproteobacteria bacterium]
MTPSHRFHAHKQTPASHQGHSAQRAYDRIAPLYDFLDGVYEYSWKRRLREELFRHARGRILDVGIGTGCNMPFYPQGSEVVGIDMSERMLDRAQARAHELGRHVTLRPMNLLSLDFPDASFDTVTVTFVLLCLPEDLQTLALQELRRATRPDGRILLLDYRLSKQPALRLWRRCIAPWMKWAFAGRFDTTTERYLSVAGLNAVEHRTFMSDGVVMLVLEPC